MVHYIQVHFQHKVKLWVGFLFKIIKSNQSYLNRALEAAVPSEEPPFYILAGFLGCFQGQILEFLLLKVVVLPNI